MKQVMDQAVLLLYCLAVVWLKPVDAALTAAFLIAVIYASINFYAASKKVNLAMTIGYVCAAFFFPDCVLFLPLILYGIMEHRQYIWGICAGGVCLYYFWGNFSLLNFLGIGCIVSLMLQNRTEKYERLEDKMRRIRDDSTETNLILKKKIRYYWKNRIMKFMRPH